MKQFIVKGNTVTLSIEELIEKFKPYCCKLSKSLLTRMKSYDYNDYIYNTFDYEDIYNELSIIIMHAYNGYNISFGCDISTYAIEKLKGHAKRLYRDSLKLRRKDNYLSNSIISYNININNDENKDTTLLDIISQELSVTQDISNDILDFKNVLTDREAKVLTLRLKDYTQEYIGQTLDISQVTVSRDLNKIKNKYTLYSEDEKYIGTIKKAPKTDKIIITKESLKEDILREIAIPSIKEKEYKSNLRIISKTYSGQYFEYMVKENICINEYFKINNDELASLVNELESLINIL